MGWAERVNQRRTNERLMKAVQDGLESRDRTLAAADALRRDLAAARADLRRWKIATRVAVAVAVVVVITLALVVL